MSFILIKFSFKPIFLFTCIAWFINSYLCALLCRTLCNPMDCSLPSSSVHGIFQARILKWVAFSYSRGSSQSKDWTPVSRISCIDRWILYHCTSWEGQGLSCSMCGTKFPDQGSNLGPLHCEHRILATAPPRVWVNSGSWWWTGRPGMLQFMRLQRVRHNWMNELNWTTIGIPIPLLGWCNLKCAQRKEEIILDLEN